MPIQSVSISEGSYEIGRFGLSRIVIRHAATTAISKLQAAKAEDETIQLTDFFSEVNTTMVTNIVADRPPRKALTKDNCSATASKYFGFKLAIIKNSYL